MGEAFEEIGFVALENHYLDDALIAELYSEVKKFFALPLEIKRKYEIAGVNGQRGYTPFGKEHAKGRTEGDLKEFWHFGQENGEAKNLKNVYVEELPCFNEIGMQAYRMLEKTGFDILKALALYLGLDASFFDSNVRKGDSILRPIHYPPITNPPQGAVRAAAHTDVNLITLLMGASGLEIQRKDGTWSAVTVLPEHLIINVGDMISRMTNDRLTSTVHRVVNPPREDRDTSRYSIPFFVHPGSEMPLNCLDNCINRKNPKRYEDITAGDFLRQRLAEIGLAEETKR